MKKMRIIPLGIIVVLVLLLVQPVPVEAAVNENFDSYPYATVVDTLSNSNVTYFSFGSWYTLDVVATFALGNGKRAYDDMRYIPLDITFPQDQDSLSFVYAQFVPGTVNLALYNNGVQVFAQSYASAYIGGTFAEGQASVSGILFDNAVISHPPLTGNDLTVDNLVTTNAPVPGGGGVTVLVVPHVSDIRIDSWAPVVVYGDPEGEPAKLSDGTVIVLPQDYDNNGFDTYIVTEVRTVNGRVWVSIFLGNTSFVWVPLDQVTPISPIP